MTKEIILAETMGFCWGVRRTLEIIEQAGSPVRRIATIGDVIHNPQVVDRLRGRGIDTAASVDEAERRGFSQVAITAHGAGPDRTDDAARRGLNVIDTTCPLVTRVQRLGQKLVRQGYFLVIYGDARHPEAKGILAWANTKKAVVAKCMDDLPWEHEDDAHVPRKIALISQTTKNVQEFMEFAQQLLVSAGSRGYEVRICNSICEPTARRQEAIHDLARQVDAVLVIGGHKSSNTARLAEVGRSYGVPSYHIESHRDIDDDWLAPVRRIGITAGASTPDDVILEVIESLKHRGFSGPVRPFVAESLDAVPAY